MGLNREWIGYAVMPPKRVAPVFLHCDACRLPSTPSRRRILEYPSVPAQKVCDIQVRFRGHGR